MCDPLLQDLSAEELVSDDFVKNKLQEWGLEDYITKFQREKIDKEVFLTLPKEAIAELITEIGPRFTFLRKRDIFLEMYSVSRSISESSQEDTLSTSSFPSSDLSCSSRTGITGQKLRLLLQASVIGRLLLSQVHLTQSERNQLSTIIIEDLLNKNLKIKTEDFKFWANEIVSLFKNEKLGTYFTAYQGGQNKQTAKGKLWDKYANIKRKIKKTGSTCESICEIPEKDNIQENDDLLKLHCTSLDDEVAIKDLWKKTFLQRRRNISLDTYFEQYLMLRAPIGPTLLQIDYETLGLTDLNIFLKAWPDLSKNIIRLAEEKSIGDYLLHDKEQVPTDILALRLLPYLFRPGFVKTGSKKKWKPSKQEQADGFILWINTIADMDRVMVARENLMKSYGLTCQPTVVAVGLPAKVDAAYVCINDVKYNFTSVVAAVDTCFKAFYALDAKYPVQSEVVWTFLQLAVYGIKDTNKNYVSVNAIFTDLDRIKQSADTST